MIITLPSFVLYDTSIPIRLISNVTTQYTYETILGLQNIATNNDHVITIPAVISKPVNEGVSLLAIVLTYTTALFTSSTVIDDTLTPSKTQMTTVNIGVNTVITTIYTEDGGVSDFLTGSGDVLFRYQLAAIDTGVVSADDMVLTWPTFSLYDSGVPIRVISSFDMLYTYIAYERLNPIVSNIDNVITYPVAIFKPVGFAVDRFTVSLRYTKALFSSVVITDNVLTPGNQTTVSSIGFTDTIIEVRYVKNPSVFSFLTCSDSVLFNFKLTTTGDPFTISPSNMVLSLTEFVLRDDPQQLNITASLTTQYTHIPSVKLIPTATNSLNDIFFHVAISKPTGEAVYIFSIMFEYITASFTAVEIVDDTLEASKVTKQQRLTGYLL